MRIFFLFTVLFCSIASPGAIAQNIEADSTSAVILAYHRIGEDAFPATNLRQEQFAEHIDELNDGTYNIISLPDLIAHYKAGDTLPERTIAITFEGGYRSAYENAIPLLLEKEIPFTVFFAANQVTSRPSQYMDWKDLQTLQSKENISFGLLPAAYTRLSGQPKENILLQINRAKTQYRRHLKGNPAFFSYPFGEYDQAYTEIIKDQGFAAAFGLQSGVAYAGQNPMQLPRFSMTESYGDLDRLRMIANALPLPVSDLEPAYSVQNTNRPSIGFTLSDDLKAQGKNMSCFASGDVNLEPNIIGDKRLELRLSAALNEERTRINCTMPGPQNTLDDVKIWRWLGMLLIYRDDENINQEQPELP